MCETGTVMVTDGGEEDLCFTFETAERTAMKNTVTIALEIGAKRTGFLGMSADSVRRMTSIFTKISMFVLF